MTDTVFHPNIPDVVPRELTYANPRQTVIIESWDEKILPEGRAESYSFNGASNRIIIPIYGQTGTAIDFQDSYFVVWLDGRGTIFQAVADDTALVTDSSDNPIQYARNYNIVFSENIFCIFRELIIRNGKNAVLQRISDVNRIKSILDLCAVTPVDRVSFDGTIAGFGPEEVQMKDFRRAFWKLRFKVNIGILDMEELYPIGASSGLRLEFVLEDPAVYMRILRQRRFQYSSAAASITLEPPHPNAYDTRVDLTRQGVGWNDVVFAQVGTSTIFPENDDIGLKFQEFTSPNSHNANQFTQPGPDTTFGVPGMHQSFHPIYSMKIVKFEAHIRYKRMAEDFWRAQLLSIKRLNEEGFSGLAIPFKSYCSAKRQLNNTSQVRFNPQLEEGNTDALIAAFRYARHERGDMSDWLKEGLFTLTPYISTPDEITVDQAGVVYPLNYVWKIGGDNFPRNRIDFEIDSADSSAEPNLSEMWRELKGSLCPQADGLFEHVAEVGMLDKWSFGSTAQAYPFWRVHQVSNEFAASRGPFVDQNEVDLTPVPISLFPNTFGVHESAFGKVGSLYGSGIKSGTAPGKSDLSKLDANAFVLDLTNQNAFNESFNAFQFTGCGKDIIASMSASFSAPEPFVSIWSQDLMEDVGVNSNYSVAKKVLCSKNPHSFFCADLKKSRSKRWFDGRSVTSNSLAPQFEINFKRATPNGVEYVLDVWAIQSKLLTFWPDQKEAVLG